MVGTGRSGTSEIARICEELLGLDMGGPGEQTETNPDGRYERAEVVALDRQLIGGEISEGEWRDGMREIAASLEGPWGLKHPANCKFLRLHYQIWYDAPTIWAYRDTEATAESFSRAYGRDVESCRNTVRRRRRALDQTLATKNPLIIDMTERRDPDELAEIIREYLEQEGVL